MINIIQLRRFAIGTQKLYIYAIENLAKYCNRFHDLISEEKAFESSILEISIRS